MTETINRNKESLLSQKRLRELLSYNSENGLFTNIINRSRGARVGQTAGWVNAKGYISITINRSHYQAHRLVWLYTYGKFPEGEQPFIDHINGNKLDNRLVNLRTSSNAANAKNKQMMSTNTSGVTGVCRISSWNGTKTRVYHYWIAHWRDENGKKCRKVFNTGVYGEDVAKQMAIDYRVEQIRLLEINHSVVYSDRHGT